jgi:hypothetical protein
MARSRAPRGESSLGASTTSLAASTDSSVGSPRRALGVASSSAGHETITRRRLNQRIQVRTAASLRARVLAVCFRASTPSQPRKR